MLGTVLDFIRWLIDAEPAKPVAPAAPVRVGTVQQKGQCAQSASTPSKPAAQQRDTKGWEKALAEMPRSAEEIELERQLWAETGDMPKWLPPKPAVAKTKPMASPTPAQAAPITKPTASRKRPKAIKDGIDLEALLASSVIYDLETTGLKAAEEHIIQIGAVRIRDGRVVDRFSQLVKPPVLISSFIEEYTGIRNRDVRNAPPAIQAIRSFSSWAGSEILVAHNGNRFDRAFLKAELERAKEPMREIRGLDTLELAKRVIPTGQSKGIDGLMARYGVKVGGRRHEAEADVMALFQIMKGLIPEAMAAGHRLGGTHPIWLSNRVG